jgi:HD superfamily phosphodiesterase
MKILKEWLDSNLHLLFDELLEFVEKSTKNFDDSHNYKHALNVTKNSLIIGKDYQNKNEWKDHRLLLICSMLHDVCDTKYKHLSISENELRSFVLQQTRSEDETTRIIKIIESVSYSKQIKSLTYESELSEEDKLVLYILRDADRIEAIGLAGIERCRIYTIQSNPHILGINDINKLVLQHCHEKLLKLYTDYFIVTDKGREIAEPLHIEMMDYVNNLESIE